MSSEQKAVGSSTELAMRNEVLQRLLMIGVFAITIHCQHDIAQTRGKVSSQHKVPTASGRVNQQKPAIYLEVECENRSVVRLRLHNNTAWAISIPTYSFYFNPKKIVTIKLKNGRTAFPLPGDRDISSIYYFVEKDAEKDIQVPKLSYPDSFNESWVAPSNSIRFPVPREHLKEGLRIFIAFNYEWELTDQGIISSDVQHRVFFREVTLRNLDSPATCK